MRNHLSICELYCEIIKKNLDKSGIENDSVNNALKCIKRSLKIMGNSILDLKSLDNLKPGKYDLKQLMDEAVETSKVYGGRFTCSAQKNVQVYVDENKFLGCIVNILKNAVEAGADKIRITASADREYARINISNNGTPILPEKQREIFNEGFTTKQSGGVPSGRGLGLFICKNNLAALNAELKLIKSDKKSTEFEITLPVS
ncbi:MAG: hypothetical protein LBK53_04390 [Heliobacteriaceae bacterium]|nr:hypothetical protein [Heliobacteriaceae bacterium]